MQEIHSGLSEYMCVLDGKDKAVDGNKWNFTSVSGIMDKDAWAQITLSLKGGAFQEFLIRFRSLYGGNAYLCNGLNEYFSTVYDNLSSNMLIIRWGNKDNNFFLDSFEQNTFFCKQ